MSACFSNSGKWLNIEAVPSEKEIPAKLPNTVQTAYPGWKVESVESYETPELKAYELGNEKGKEELEIQVTADGKITVNKELEED